MPYEVIRMLGEVHAYIHTYEVGSKRRGRRRGGGGETSREINLDKIGIGDGEKAKK